jgi:UDP-N-acetylglucosamine 2-epimerase (non-hydrolysing)
VTVGSNEVVGTDPAKIIASMNRIVAGQWKKGDIPESWDGKANECIVARLEK